MEVDEVSLRDQRMGGCFVAGWTVVLLVGLVTTWAVGPIGATIPAAIAGAMSVRNAYQELHRTRARIAKWIPPKRPWEILELESKDRSRAWGLQAVAFTIAAQVTTVEKLHDTNQDEFWNGVWVVLGVVGGIALLVIMIDLSQTWRNALNRPGAAGALFRSFVPSKATWQPRVATVALSGRESAEVDAATVEDAEITPKTSA